jgi:hypothetical protein
MMMNMGRHMADAAYLRRVRHHIKYGLLTAWNNQLIGCMSLISRLQMGLHVIISGTTHSHEYPDFSDSANEHDQIISFDHLLRNAVSF